MLNSLEELSRAFVGRRHFFLSSASAARGAECCPRSWLDFGPRLRLWYFVNFMGCKVAELLVAPHGRRHLAFASISFLACQCGTGDRRLSARMAGNRRVSCAKARGGWDRPDPPASWEPTPMLSFRSFALQCVVCLGFTVAW